MKRILGIGQRCGSCRRRLSQLTTEAVKCAEQDIVIPKRIPRAPTDILRALASTIHRDPTAADYKFIDDPFLIPSANFDKRSYALSKESGRNAARYFLENFPHLFKNNPADPDIKHFNAPRPAFQAGQENTEEDLLCCIDELGVTQALIVYENLQTQGAEITEETLLKLLQLLSYFNAAEPIDPSRVEEKFYQRLSISTRNSWTAGDITQKIFEKIPNKSAEAYSALIQGMLKYYDAERGYQLYEEMRSKQLVPSIHVFNYLIPTVPRLKESYEARSELLVQILEDMKYDGVQPNLITFNNALRVCQRLGSSTGRQFCSKILAEMDFLKIQPSLATYRSVLLAMYKPRGGPAQVVYEVMEKVVGHRWEIRDSSDPLFLTTAMEILHEFVPDKDLAYKLIELAEQNEHLLSNSLWEAAFYQMFFMLLCKTEDIDKFMSVYHRFAPNIYSPEPSVLAEILTAIELHRAYRYVPQLWSDIILLRLSENGQLIKKMLALTAVIERGTSSESEKLQQQCVVIAHDILTRIIRTNEERDRLFRMPLTVDAEMISNMIQCHLNGDNLEYAAAALKYLIKNQQRIPGVPSATVLMRFAKCACEKRDEQTALACAIYCSEIGHQEIVDFVKDDAVKQNFQDDFLLRLENRVPDVSKVE